MDDMGGFAIRLVWEVQNFCRYRGEPVAKLKNGHRDTVAPQRVRYPTALPQTCVKISCLFTI